MRKLLLVMLVVSPVLFAGGIVEELNPPPDRAKILLNPPDRPYRVIAVLSDDFLKMKSDQKAVRYLAKKAKKMGADAILPGEIGSKSTSAVGVPMGYGFIVVQGSRKVVTARAIKFTDK